MQIKYHIIGLLTIVSAMVIIGGALTYKSPSLQSSQIAQELTASKNRLTVNEPDKKLAYGKLPIHFEPNQGQIHETVAFMSRVNGYQLYLTSTEAVMTLKGTTADTINKQAENHSVLRMQMVGDSLNTNPKISGQQHLTGISSYFHGKDQKQWHSSVPHYARVHYSQIYPGIDLEYYGSQQKLEYDFIIQPEADPNQIRLSFQGIDSMKLSEQGDLLLSIDGSEFVQSKPIIYQEINGERQPVQGAYVLHQNDKQNKQTVGFQLAAYDSSKTLVIDPVLDWSTYLGGSLGDTINDIELDAKGNVYIAGKTNSMNFPTGNTENNEVANGMLDSSHECFVAKLNPSGEKLLWSVFLGGDDADECTAIKVSNSETDDVNVVGSTFSADFPAHNSFGGMKDGFVARINNQGTRILWSIYWGGSGFDQINDIALDHLDNLFVVGNTESPDFPLLGTILDGNIVEMDAFIAQFGSDGSPLWSADLAGSDDDYALGIVLTINDYGYTTAYITGGTESSDFYTVNALDGTFNGVSDVFITKIRFEFGSPFIAYSTYLGGSASEQGQSIALDASGNLYVVGSTDSGDFPIINALNDQINNTGVSGLPDGFVTKINATGTGVAYSTYLGGDGLDFANSIVVDVAGSALVTGSTDSTDFPITDNALYSTTSGGVREVFVTKFSPDGTSYAYSTYLGGTGNDRGYGITVDDSGNAYIAGETYSADFPVQNALDDTYNGTGDGFITRIATEPYPAPQLMEPSGIVEEAGIPLSFVWKESLGATWYYLYVNQGTANVFADWFRAEELDCGGEWSEFCVTPYPLTLTKGNVTWWVLAWNRYGRSEWSDAMHVQIGIEPDAGKADLIEPHDTITDDTPTYKWNAVSNADRYELWVGTGATQLILQEYTIVEAGCANGTGVCEVTPTTAVSGNLRWWIKTIVDDGPQIWSDGMQFQVNEPVAEKAVLIEPHDTIVVNTPTYKWNAVSVADRYELWVGTSTTPVIQKEYTKTEAGCVNGTGVCEVTPATSVSGNQRWWIKTILDTGSQKWSDGMSFTAP